MNTKRVVLAIAFILTGRLCLAQTNEQANVESLQQAGIPSVYYESPETAHEWQSWRHSLDTFTPLLFQERPTVPTPPLGTIQTSAAPAALRNYPSESRPACPHALRIPRATSGYQIRVSRAAPPTIAIRTRQSK